jgi:acyl-coenzyme A synthetase/AMP-(fatty) acid ligase
MLRAAAPLSEIDGPLLVCEPDPLKHTVACLGALAAGGVPMLVDSRLPDAAVARVAERAGAQTIFGRALPGLHLIEDAELGDRPPAEPRRFPRDQIGTIFLTSGSTGEPKLVQRQRAADLHATMGLKIADLPFIPGDRFWISVPHTSIAWCSLLFAVYISRVTAVFAHFDAGDPGGFMQALSIKGTYMVPTMVRLANQHAGLDHPGWLDLRFVMVGGEKLDDVTREHLLDKLGNRVFMGYGMTESPRVCEARPRDLRERPGTVGQALPLRQFMIAEPGTTEPVPFGEEGDVLVRSPDLFYGYLGDEPAGDWHPTGDVGRMDDDAYLYITGRAGSVLKIGGNRLSTDEVTTAIRRHPDVAQAAVIAVPDPVWTHRLHAFVVADAELAEAALDAWLRQRLPAYKVPRAISFVDELPQDNSGKLSLTTLKRMAESV